MQRIHLIAPAGNLQSFYQHLGVETGVQMVALFQEYVGTEFQLTANVQILDAREDELRGGRFDDDARAQDITAALADDDVTAILAVRGGAWFTRILPKIEFSVLDRRSKPISALGFSELTPFINIVAHHSMGRGYHDMGPAFLVYGLKRYAAQILKLSDATQPTPQGWTLGLLRKKISEYFRQTIDLLQGRNHPIAISAELVRGRSPAACLASFVGGNLTVLSTLIGSPFEKCIDPTGRWLALEDFNDKLERFDRFLSHLTLAGFWNRCAGLMVGDFHRAGDDLQREILSILEYHLPIERDFPVLSTSSVGHTLSNLPLPLNHEGRWSGVGGRVFEWRPKPRS